MRRWLIVLSLWFALASAHPAFAADSGSCPAARLRAGMSAVVAPDVDALNLRALPARDTGVVGRLNARTPLTIIGGGSCNGRLRWWRVERDDGVRGWVAEGDWDAFYVIPARDLTTGYTPTPFDWSCGGAADPRRCPLP
jgi:hypothetical protein